MPAPTEERTFLFTDIESSSAMWEADAAAMGRALHIHDELVSHCIAQAGGEIVKHTGDGACAAFPSPAAAVAGAVDLMGALQRQIFPGLDRPLQVRMGLHTGEAEFRDGDYFGRAVNRAARVMDAANGNQIVVSHRSASHCPGRRFEDKGTHDLKGVGVERLMLLTDENLIVDPRPLRVRRPSNLPLATNASVGRAGVAAELASRLCTARTLTLLGTGGVGKTRLAVQVAERVADRFPDGVWFCDLGNLSDPVSVGPAVAEIVGAPPMPGRSMAESVGVHLAARQALVILDNCEHVLDQARAVAHQILRRAAGCAVAATSREPLHLEGEQLSPVPALDPATEGPELLVQRARERDPGFVLDAGGAVAAREICTRLDGNPLAIELAAARLAVLSPEGIAQRLADRFKLLRATRPSGARQSTLLNTIQWSYDLLTDDERHLFDALSVFSGGFSLEAAAAVGAASRDEYETLDLVTNLVDKSMVQRDCDLTEERFVLLESLREFGRVRLEASARAGEVRDLHVAWFARLAGTQAARLYTPEEPSAWHLLTVEWDNIRGAVQRALDTANLDHAADIIESIHYFSVIALRFEGLNWSELWLAHPDAQAHGRRGQIEAVAASAAYTSMDLERACQLALKGVELHDLRFLAMPFTAVWAFLALADVQGATRFVDAWLQVELHEKGRPFDVAMVAAAAAVVHGVMYRDEATALDHLRRLDGIASSVGSPSAIAYALLVRGTALARVDPERALEALAAAAGEARKLDDRHAFIDGSETALAQILSNDPDLGRTMRHCSNALASAARHRFLPRIAHDLQSAAIVLARSGDASTGARLLGASAAMGQRSWGNAFRLLHAKLPEDFHRLVADGGQLTPEAAAAEALVALRQALVDLEGCQ